MQKCVKNYSLNSNFTHLRSNVLELEWGRAGLCGGRLFGPSMLRDINEFLTLLAAAMPFEVATKFAWFTSDSVFGAPGVLNVEVDRWFLGDDGAEPTVLRI